MHDVSCVALCCAELDSTYLLVYKYSIPQSTVAINTINSTNSLISTNTMYFVLAL